MPVRQAWREISQWRRKGGNDSYVTDGNREGESHHLSAPIARHTLQASTTEKHIPWLAKQVRRIVMPHHATPEPARTAPPLPLHIFMFVLLLLIAGTALGQERDHVKGHNPDPETAADGDDDLVKEDPAARALFRLMQLKSANGVYDPS